MNSGKHLTWTGSPLSPFRDQRVKYELKQVIRAAEHAWRQHFKNQNQADFLDLFLSDLICRVDNSARPSDGRRDLHTAVTPHYKYHTTRLILFLPKEADRYQFYLFLTLTNVL